MPPKKQLTVKKSSKKTKTTSRRRQRHKRQGGKSVTSPATESTNRQVVKGMCQTATLDQLNSLLASVPTLVKDLSPIILEKLKSGNHDKQLVDVFSSGITTILNNFKSDPQFQRLLVGNILDGIKSNALNIMNKSDWLQNVMIATFLKENRDLFFPLFENNKAGNLESFRNSLKEDYAQTLTPTTAAAATTTDTTTPLQGGIGLGGITSLLKKGKEMALKNGADKLMDVATKATTPQSGGPPSVDKFTDGFTEEEMEHFINDMGVMLDPTTKSPIINKMVLEKLYIPILNSLINGNETVVSSLKSAFEQSIQGIIEKTLRPFLKGQDADGYLQKQLLYSWLEDKSFPGFTGATPAEKYDEWIKILLN